MIPSLAAAELREAIVEYLSTTFAIGDEDDADALVDVPPGRGRRDLPRTVPARAARRSSASTRRGWRSPLDWHAEGLPPVRASGQGVRAARRPATAIRSRRWSRPAPARARPRLPIPILDHCAARGAGRPAGDQGADPVPDERARHRPGRPASRALIARASGAGRRDAPASASAATAAARAVMTETRIIDDQHALRDDPPDILLTNYKMLDFCCCATRTASCGQTPSPDVAALPRARRVPHLRRRAGHRRRDAAAPARCDARTLGDGWPDRSGRSRRWRRRRRSAIGRRRPMRCASSPRRVFGVPVRRRLGHRRAARVGQRLLQAASTGTCRSRTSTTCGRSTAPT